MGGVEGALFQGLAERLPACLLCSAHRLQSLSEAKPAGTQGLRGAHASQAAEQLVPWPPGTTVISPGRGGTGGAGVMGLPAQLPVGSVESEICERVMSPPAHPCTAVGGVRCM